MQHRVLASTAALAIVAAGASLLSKQSPSAPQKSPSNPPRSRPTSTETASPPTRPKPAPHAPPRALRVARSYTLAATSWSAASYADSRSRRACLSAGRLGAELRTPIPSEFRRQLRSDNVSRLGAVRDVRVAHREAARADVRVTIDELLLQTGSRARQRTTYRVQLELRGARWRVVAFGAVAVEGA